MTANINTVSINHGTANSQTITGQANSATFSLLQWVTLSSNYMRLIPPGMPDPNPGVDPKLSKTSYPQTILSGQRVQFHSHEAAALVAAGAGTLS